MLVILLGQIDLSLPWVVSVGAMMSSAVAGLGDVGAAIAIPFGIFCGVLIGLVNGVGVAYLRIPSMIMTLGHQCCGPGPDGCLHRWLLAAGSASPAARYSPPALSFQRFRIPFSAGWPSAPPPFS